MSTILYLIFVLDGFTSPNFCLLNLYGKLCIRKKDLVNKLMGFEIPKVA